MPAVAIVYHSTTGTTGQLAQALLAGVQTVEQVQASVHRIDGEDIHQGRFVNEKFIEVIGQADAIVFGSPTYMGSVSAQFKAFADATGELWAARQWADKIAAGFTIGSNYAGDQLSTLQYLKTFASQHGMLWLGLDIPGGFESGVRNRLGSQSGLIAQTRDNTVHADDLGTAKYLGARVAKFAVGE
jgi:NAD(P)H dehydrogenase (quinone)